MISGKRGDYEVYFFIFLLIMVGIVVVTFISFQQKAANADTLDLLYAVRDVALFVDAAYASPGQLHANYDTSFLRRSAFVYTIEKSRVKVQSPPEKREDGTIARAPPPETYVFAQDTNFMQKAETIGARKDNTDESAAAIIYIKNQGYVFDVISHIALGFSKKRHTLAKSGNVGEIVITATDDALRGMGTYPGAQESAKEYDIYVRLEKSDDGQITLLIPPVTAARSRKLATLMHDELMGLEAIKREKIGITIAVSDDEELSRAREAGVVVRVPLAAAAPGLVAKALRNYE